jgi:endonuclease III
VVNLEQRLAMLADFYGPLSAPPRDPFIFYVWEVLNATSTPRKALAALDKLQRSRTLTPDAVWHARTPDLEAAVGTAGPNRDARVEALRAGASVFRRKPDFADVLRGPLSPARRALRQLPILGRAGAHRMLLFVAGRPVLPIDARVHRVATRLGYGERHPDFPKSSRSVRRALSAELPATPDTLRRAYLYLAHHGAMTCTEADPHCTVCPLLAGCATGEKRRSVE